MKRTRKVDSGYWRGTEFYWQVDIGKKMREEKWKIREEWKSLLAGCLDSSIMTIKTWLLWSLKLIIKENSNCNIDIYKWKLSMTFDWGLVSAQTWWYICGVGLVILVYKEIKEQSLGHCWLTTTSHPHSTLENIVLLVTLYLVHVPGKSKFITIQTM